jgi:hypothetical protein
MLSRWYERGPFAHLGGGLRSKTVEIGVRGVGFDNSFMPPIAATGVARPKALEEGVSDGLEIQRRLLLGGRGNEVPTRERAEIIRLGEYRAREPFALSVGRIAFAAKPNLLSCRADCDRP